MIWKDDGWEVLLGILFSDVRWCQGRSGEGPGALHRITITAPGQNIFRKNFPTLEKNFKKLF
jgi:hypothetical protein